MLLIKFPQVEKQLPYLIENKVRRSTMGVLPFCGRGTLRSERTPGSWEPGHAEEPSKGERAASSSKKRGADKKKRGWIGTSTMS